MPKVNMTEPSVEALKFQINDFIEKYKFEIVSRTCDFVKIPSVSIADDSGKPYGKECARALDFCDNLCKEKGLFTKNYDYHCIEAVTSQNHAGKKLVVVTHVDVVPVDGDNNLYHPFAGTVYGNYIIGRGSVDDKGPLIASIYALAFFKEHNIRLRNDIRLVFGSNEESGMDDMEFYLKTAGQPDWALSGDGDFPVDNGEKAQVKFTVAAHKSANVDFIKSRGTRKSLIHEYCEATINNRNVTIGKTSRQDSWSSISKLVNNKHIETENEGISNPVAYTILSSNVPIYLNSDDEKQIRALLSDCNGSCMGINFSDDISGDTSLNVYKAETIDDNIILSFSVGIPVSVNLNEIADKIYDYAKRTNLHIEILKQSNGFYQKPNQKIVAMLTDLYNTEFQTDKAPNVMKQGHTYIRLFDRGCGFGGGHRNEIKPFPAGHGSCHGADEAESVYTLLDDVKMFILGIKAIDDMWTEESANTSK